MKTLRLRGIKVTQLVDGKSEVEDISINTPLRRVDQTLCVEGLAECLSRGRCSHRAVWHPGSAGT